MKSEFFSYLMLVIAINALGLASCNDRARIEKLENQIKEIKIGQVNK